jgi:archaellum component FlaC
LAVQEKLPWSEEVLVSKAELEERRSHVAELEQQVAELTMQTEYQLRLKDLHVQVGETDECSSLQGASCWMQP